jgi:hypothetical protein
MPILTSGVSTRVPEAHVVTHQALSPTDKSNGQPMYPPCLPMNALGRTRLYHFSQSGVSSGLVPKLSSNILNSLQAFKSPSTLKLLLPNSLIYTAMITKFAKGIS